MPNNNRIYTALFLIVSFFGCKNTVQVFGYDVSEIYEMSPQRIEDLNEFKVKGVVGENVNLGFINAFTIADVTNQDMRIFVVSEKSTSPGLAGQIVSLKLKLYKELSFGGETILLFKEFSS